MEIVREKTNPWRIDFRKIGLSFLVLYIVCTFMMIQHLTVSTDRFLKADVGNNFAVEGFTPKQPLDSNKTYGCYGNPPKQSEFVDIGKGYFVLSAYLDRRESTQTVIRILSIKPTESSSQVYCLIPNADNSLNAVPATELVLDNKDDSHEYSAVVFHCELEKVASTLCKVWLGFSPKLDKKTVPLPLLHLNPELNYDNTQFLVCVPPLDGVVQQNRFVEFIETQVIFGAHKFQVYSFTGDKNQAYNNPNINQILEFYHGQITKRSWQLPIPKESISKLAGNLAMTECFLEVITLGYKYALQLALNEYLVPHNVATWVDMIQPYPPPPHQPSDLGAFCFPVERFAAQSGELLLTLTSIFRHKREEDTAITTSDVICVVRSEAVAYKSSAGVELVAGWQHTTVDPTLGHAHRYVVCSSFDWSVGGKDNNIMDRSMAKYSAELEHRFKRAMQRLARFQHK